MRRALLLLALAAVVAVIVTTTSGDSSRREVAVMFDSARGLVSGQLVKVAGARVGSITDLDLQRQRDGGYKALVTLDVPERFEFRADAQCKILPEGLISENYVDCDPGRRGELEDGPTGVPTVPVESTSASINLQDVLNVFSMPTTDRVRLFIDTLGISTAGRGEDINAILRRANPALTEANELFEIVADQNTELATAVGQTDQVLTELASNEDDVRSFVARAADVTRTTADHRMALGEGIRELPEMLDALDAGLLAVDRVALAAPPLLANLRAAAPGLQQLTDVTPTFARAAVPGLEALGRAARTGLDAIGPVTPFVENVRNFAEVGGPAVSSLEQLLVDSRDEGAIEGLLTFMYNFAAFTAPYDDASHTPGLYIANAPDCQATNAAGVAKDGCLHSYDSPGLGQLPINAPNVDPGPNTAAILDTGAGPSMRRSARTAPAPLSDQQSADLLEFLLR